MGKSVLERRKEEFIDTICRIKCLPRIWQFNFTDGYDQRLWFNSIIRIEEFKYTYEEIKVVMDNYGIKVLNNNEKEKEFLNYIEEFQSIPLPGEVFFLDNDDMHTWYMSYKGKNDNFETKVHNSLPEFNELNLAEIWSDSKKEFANVIMRLKRIPKHGEVFLQNGIDVRTIYDKLESFDPEYYEQILLHLQTYKKNSLSINDRVEEMIREVSILGYIPTLQESRFIDGTDMFTWYQKYKERYPEIGRQISSYIKKDSNNSNKKKVNIYMIPHFKETGGKFYMICTNEGERLDLSDITSFEEAKLKDDSLTKRGGVLLKRDEEIASVNFVKGKKR